MADFGITTIKQILENNHLPVEIATFDQSTRTAAEAAKALKCEVGQIAKSLVFKLDNNQAVLIVASGKNRVDLELFAKSTGLAPQKADADFCREVTGFVIGGIPPFGHKTALVTYIDRDLLKYNTVWASAGGPNSVFKIDPRYLAGLANGQMIRVN